MKRLSIRQWLVVACALCFQANVVAGEPARRFLDELRNRQYFDMAVAYLDQLAGASKLPADLRDTIDYEIGITLIQQSVERPQESKAQERVLLAAQEKLNAFLSKHPQHAMANIARARLGHVQASRAVSRKLQSLQPRVSAEESASLRMEAIELYDEARQIYEDGRAAIRRQLESMPKQYDAEVEPDKAKHLARLRSEYIAVRFKAAVVQFEKAMIAPSDSTLRKQTLSDAEQRFESLLADYSNRSNAVLLMQAQLFLGRCNQEAGKLKEAIGFFTDILDKKEETLSDPMVRKVASESLMRAIDSWNTEKLKLYDAAIEKGEWWEERQRPDERKSPEWLGFKLSLANAYLGKSKAVTGSRKQKALGNARRLLNEVSKVTSPYQKTAQEQFVSLTKGKRDDNSDREPPKNFADAVQQAKDVRDEHQVATATVKLLGKRIANVSDEATRAEMQQKIDAAQAQLSELRSTEVELLTTAIRMADDDATPEQILDLQYRLALYYHLQDDQFRASVLSEFIARRYSDSMYGKSSARVALISLDRIRQSDPEFAAEASARLASVANFLLQRWPNTEASSAAIEFIIRDSVQLRDFSKAEEFLAKLGTDSKRRGKMELLVGQSLWAEFVRQRKLLPADELPAELLATKAKALDILNAGIEHRRADGVSSALLQAELSLASSYIDAGEFAQAIAILDNPKSGPQTLANEGSILVEGMERRTYLLAIQAYIGALPESDDPAATLDKAMSSMDALKKLLDAIPNGEQALIGEYIKLAQALQTQIADAPTESRNAIASGYEQVLERVAASSDSPTTLAWVGESMAKLGALLAQPSGTTSTRGHALAQRAMELYVQVLKSESLSSQLRSVLQLRVAIAKRELGDYNGAIEEFVKLLNENEKQLHVQIEAAKTYQQWGKRSDKNAYKKAIRGSHAIAVKGGKNLIWGWGRLTQILAGNAKYRELFHESRYNLALCRYEFAMKSGKTDKQKSLQSARNELILTTRMYPDLGGPDRKKQYEALLKKVQLALGK